MQLIAGEGLALRKGLARSLQKRTSVLQFVSLIKKPLLLRATAGCRTKWWRMEGRMGALPSIQRQPRDDEQVAREQSFKQYWEKRQTERKVQGV